jgi:hypothetical protein
MNRKVVRNLSASSYFLEGNHNPSSGGVVSSSKMSGETKTSTLKTGTGGGPSLPKNGFVQQKAGSGSNSKQVVNPATLGSKTKNNGIQMSSSTEKQQQYGNGIGSMSLDEQMLYRTRGLNTARGSTTNTTTTGKLLGL